MLRFYGPVFDSADDYGDDDPATKPVIVSSQSIGYVGSPPPFTDITSSCDVSVPGNGSREVWIARKLVGGSPVPFGNQHRYRVTPVIDYDVTQLRSDWTFLEPENAPNVRDFAYNALECLEPMP